MNKSVKKIISVLLTAGMLLGACGTGAFAEDAADTSATTTATAQVSTFDSDSYYNEAAGLLTKMGIFQGYEDGTLKPDSTITRAEMSAVILRIMDMTATSEYSDVFSDVTSSHWAAKEIQTAYNAGIINGMGDGTFAPDSPVTFEQAVKMLVCAIGYGNLAAGQGGYPTGYIKVAARKGIEVTKNVNAQTGDEAARGNVIKMAYNTINALYPTGSKMTSDGIEYTTDDDVTVGSKLHNVFSNEGVVTATYSTSIDPTASVSEQQVRIGNLTYNRNGMDMEKYIGYKIKVYYEEYNEDGDRKIIYVVPNKKNDTLVIDADDVEAITNIRTENAKIEYTYSSSSSKTKKASLDTPTIIYNGKILRASDVPSGTSIEDFITPDVGQLTLNDYDGDGEYDVLFVDSYDTYVVTSATDKIITGKYNTPNKLDVDTEDGTLILNITKGGKSVASKTLKKWDVATVQKSANVEGDVVMNIDICNETVEGKITDVDTDDDGDHKVTINGKEYKVDKNLFANEKIESSKEGVFYLDKFGRIAGMDSTSSSKLSSSEQYGWLMRMKKSNEENEWILKMFTQGGKVEDLKLADSVTFWGPQLDADERTLKSTDSDYDQVLTEADAYMRSALVDSKYQVALVKYSLNSDGDIKKLIMPVVTTNYSNVDDDRVVVYAADLDNSKGSGTMLANKFYMQDGMVQFNVPEKVANVTDTAAYSISTANSGDYIDYEGISATFTVAEMDGNKPGVVIKYIAATSEAADFTINTADDASWMMISDIQRVYDENEDEEVYKITGYANGNKMEYTTTTTTSVSQATATDGIAISGGVLTDVNGKLTKGYTSSELVNRTYGVVPLWTAANNIPTYSVTDSTTNVTTPYPIISTANQAKYNSLTDVLAKGDIVALSTSGLKVNTLIKMVDMSDYLEDSSTLVWGQEQNFSGTRDAVAGGKIINIDTDETVKLTLESGDVFSYDPGYYVITYNVSKKKVDDDVVVSDLQEYDSSDKTGDVVVLRNFKGGQREVFAIRFE